MNVDLLNPRDLALARLLTAGASHSRIVAIGAYNRTWGPHDIPRVTAGLAHVEPDTSRWMGGTCGKESGVRAHRQAHEPLCEPCEAWRQRDLAKRRVRDGRRRAA